ncbi:MAG: sulfotransferase [Planctomycetota bacterium]|nr:MAG: sulfotransferase [Planctomycetota bacterium]
MPNRRTQPDAQRLRVIYVMGAGRSGSTVLSALLGAHPQVIGVGELEQYLLPHQGGLDGQLCSCRRWHLQCPFWREVFDRWQSAGHGVDPQTFVAWQARYSDFRGLGHLRWLRLIGNGVRCSASFERYLAATEALLRAIAETAGRSVIVDSSKNPLRALLLGRISDLDVRVVHAVRDGRAVAWSRKKTYRKDELSGVQREFRSLPAWYTATHWSLVNAIASLVRRRFADHAALIRYEDLVTEPEATLERLGQSVGLDMRPVIDDVRHGREIPVGHMIAGNRLRMSGVIRVRADTEWIRKLPARDRRTCWIIAGWLLKRYGYTRQGECTRRGPCAPQGTSARRAA